MRKLRIKIPSVCCVNFNLQSSHFFHQGIEICIWICHFSANSIEAIHFCQDISKCLADIFDYGCLLVQRGFLLEDADRISWSEACLSSGNFFEARHYFEKGRLSHTVGTNHANFCAGIKRKRYVIKDYLVAYCLACLIHLIDKFCHLCEPFFGFGVLAIQQKYGSRYRSL